MSKISWAVLTASATALAAPTASAAENKRVCVEVVLQRAAQKPKPPPPRKPPPPPKPAPPVEGEGPPPAPPPPPADTAPPEPPDTGVVVAGSEADVLPPLGVSGKDRPVSLPIGQRPLGYLKRLLEYFVSHEKGFEAVQGGCEHTLRVELYPIIDGWTAFARYSGTGREERIDRLSPSELSQFAERAATALLYGKPISATINRETVLAADSKEYSQRISGTSHFMLGVGTQLRMGRFGTAVDNAADPRNGEAVTALRVFSPVSFFLGYRGRYEGWGLEASILASAGTAKTAASKNPGGGHIDLFGDAAVQLHFLHYFDPRGLMSFYMGGGTSFELLAFQAIRAKDVRQTGDRTMMLGGGLDVDLVLGFEFMRASTAQFFLQTELQAPAYTLSNETADGSIKGWFPSVAIKLGMLF